MLRPRFIEVGSIELVSLYLRRKGSGALPLPPHFYRMKYGERDEAGKSPTGPDLMRPSADDTVRSENGSDIYVHPLWYLLSIVRGSDDDSVDKFFVKKDTLNDRMYGVLNDTSLYYSRHGY